MRGRDRQGHTSVQPGAQLVTGDLPFDAVLLPTSRAYGSSAAILPFTSTSRFQAAIAYLSLP